MLTVTNGKSPEFCSERFSPTSLLAPAQGLLSPNRPSNWPLYALQGHPSQSSPLTKTPQTQGGYID